MNAMQRVGLGLWITAISAVAAGCGGESGMPAKSPSYADRAAPEAPTAANTSPSGYGQAAPIAEGSAIGGDSGSAGPMPAPPAPGAMRDEAAKPSRSAEPQDRPGLGTEVGRDALLAHLHRAVRAR